MAKDLPVSGYVHPSSEAQRVRLPPRSIMIRDEWTTVWVQREAANLLRVAVIRRYGKLKPHLTEEVSRALKDRAKKLAGR